ncbi:MAG: membrane protein insertase YidC [Spirosomataceae bacterium]
MGNIDKNQVIGFLLLIVMYGAYMFFIPEATSEVPAPTKVEATSTQTTAAASSTPIPTPDSTQLAATYGSFASFAQGTPQTITVENEDIKVVFSSKGGTIENVILKKYKTYTAFQANQEEALQLIDKNNSNMNVILSTLNGPVDIKQLHFSTSAVSQVVKGKEIAKVSFELALSPTQKITQNYTITGTGYQVDYDLDMAGLDPLLKEKEVKFVWEDKLKILENDLEENRKAAQINFYNAEDGFDDLGANSVGDDQETPETPVQWFSFKQKYFVTGFVSKNQALAKPSFTITTPVEDTSFVKLVKAETILPYSDLNSGKGNYRFFFGPNDYKVVNQVTEGFHGNVYLGYDIVKPINRFIFVPLFEWFENFISNYGFLIIVVVLFIKLALTPLIYKSYVSSAKMRILAPEINEIKEKVGDDQVKVQQETMKLYQEVGVSPLSGCVPMLLQMPILMSVFFLFPNMIMFRQQPFLWAPDLSTYDAPLSWATTLPIIGNHISLFVVLMTISSLAFTYYNNQITPAQPGPIDMKKISYVFPLVFFFVLNSFPAALSFYYLVSNLVTIGQQLIVRKFIDEDKIKEVLAANKVKFQTKPKKTSKFTEYLQKQLQSTEEAKKKQLEINQKKRNNKK